jgi:chromosome segregation ATPase
MALVPIVEAAHKLQVSVDTIRRRLQKGELKGQKQAGAHGHIWLIELEDETEHSNGSAARLADAEQSSRYCSAGCQAEINRLEETIAMLRERFAVQDAELEARRREVQELHVLLQQAQTALSAPGESRPWWRRLFSRG